MINERINILIKHGDIWPQSSLSYTHDPKASFRNHDDDEIYVVSDTLYHIIHRIFQDKIRFETEFDHNTFKQIVANKIKLQPTQKEKIIEFYSEQIKEQNRLLSDIINDNFYSSISELTSRTFSELFFDNGMDWVDCLKFQILNGNKLDMLQKQDPNLKYLRDFFETGRNSMNDLFAINTIELNIIYLQTEIRTNLKQVKIDEISVNENNNLSIKNTHRLRAIAYIFKNKANEYKYPALSRQEAKIFDISFYNALDDLEFFPEKIRGLNVRKKPYRKFGIKDLEKVLQLKLLSDEPAALQILTKTIERLEMK